MEDVPPGNEIDQSKVHQVQENFLDDDEDGEGEGTVASSRYGSGGAGDEGLSVENQHTSSLERAQCRVSPKSATNINK